MNQMSPGEDKMIQISKNIWPDLNPGLLHHTMLSLSEDQVKKYNLYLFDFGPVRFTGIVSSVSL